MGLLEPGYLWLLPPLLVGVWWSGRRLLGITRARKSLILVLRMVLVTLLVLTLAGPQMVQSHRGTCVVFVLDMSDSISDAGKQYAKEYIQRAIENLAEDDLVALVVFGRDALVDFTPTHTRQLPTLYSKPDPTGTNIASAIRLATALFPDGKHRRIVLLTDGNETEGMLRDTALVASTEGIEIDCVSLASVQPTKEVLILETQAPSETKIGEPFNLRVVIEARQASEATLMVDREGTPIKTVQTRLTPGKNVVVIPVQGGREGFHRYRVTMEATPDADARNNIGRAFVRVQGKPRILLAEGSPADPNRSLEKALKANNLEVVRVQEGGFPARADELQAYDAIVLHDFPAVALTPQQMQAIQTAVKETGIGFAMLGGENAFLPGGYYQTPIAELLPVDLEVRQKKVFPAATVVIVIDISGSMAVPEDGIPKVQLAGKAAVETLRLLRPMDRFGVIVSGTGVDWLAPIQPATNKDATIAQIMRIYAGGGGIYCRPSLEFAYNALLLEQTTVRHLILLADGDDCDEQEGCFELADKMRKLGITMSVVSLGNGKDTLFLQKLAQVAGGRFYLTERARDLPRLFTADASIMLRSAMVEEVFIPKIMSGEEMLQGIDWSTTPPLLGYDLTSDRPLARTLMRTHNDDPLLAVWQYGLGTSLAFTSDAKGRWAQRWLGWGEFAPFWTQVVRSILRKGGRLDYQLTVREEGGSAVIEMQAFTPEGEPINFLQPELRVAPPNSEGFTLTLQQQAPGRYIGRFPLRGIGDYLITMIEKEPDGTVRALTQGFAIPYSPEYRFSRANQPLLTQVAEITGGKLNPEPQEVFRTPQRAGKSVRDMWRSFLWLALMLLLLDITFRRVVITPAEIVAVVRNGVRRLRFGRASRPQTAPTATARLLSAKGRVRSTLSESAPARSPDAEPVSASVQASVAPSTSPPESAPAPKPSPSGSTSDTLNRLLEIKRKRGG